MNNQHRVPKTTEEKLADLDSHIFLLRQHLYHLDEGEAHLKALSAELRVLVCLSSKTEGLLWRLVDEFKVSDEIYLHVAGSVNTEYPLARDLQFVLISIQRGGFGDPRLPPDYYSLREIIKKYEAVFISGKGLTHEYLIKAIAQQMGSAHEDDGLEPALVDMRQIFINGVEPYNQLLAIEAELTIQIAERVFDEAENKVRFHRKQHSRDYGNLSVTVRFRLKQKLIGKIRLFKMHSFINEVNIICDACPQSLLFTLKKKGNVVKEITIKYPDVLQYNADTAVLFSYCSYAKKFHIVINGKPQDDDGLDCNIGWFHAGDFWCEPIDGYKDFVQGGILLHERLLSPRECLDVLELPPNLYGLLKPIEELRNDRIFPS